LTLLVSVKPGVFFVQLVGANENPNVGKKVRLQLYLPPTRVYSKEGHVEVRKLLLIKRFHS